MSIHPKLICGRVLLFLCRQDFSPPTILCYIPKHSGQSVDILRDRRSCRRRRNRESLGTAENMSRDMNTVVPTFDNRLSGMSHHNPGLTPRTSADWEVDLASADRVISGRDLKSQKPLLFHGGREEAREYLAVVDDLRHLMENLVATDSSSAMLVRAQRLMEMSMMCLQREFHRILTANVEPNLAPEDGLSDDGSTDEDGSNGSGSASRGQNSNADWICEIDMMPFDAEHDLRSIAERMVTAGYGKECVRIYGLTRKSVIEECLYKIGVERLSKGHVHKTEGAILDSKIKTWIRTMKIAVRVLFASEKRLCHGIFAGFNRVRDLCFAEVAKEPTMKLLGFGESLGMGRKSSDRLFGVLDMYDSLSKLMPDIDNVYCQECCVGVRTQASGVLVRLGEEARGIFIEFENAVHRENSKTRIPGGTIHPLTRYVMNYLSFMSDYKEALVKITANAPMDIPKGLPDGLMGLFEDQDWDDEEQGSPASVLSVRLGCLIIILQCKLDTTSKLYKDVALSYLFLMNNLNYIVQKIKDSELLGLLGHGWLTKNQSKVRQYAANYERGAWVKVLDCLRDEGTHVSEMSQHALKDKFKGFNHGFEDVLRKHSAWMVPDVQLQGELRQSIIENMVPAYRSFLGRFRTSLENGGHSEMYIKYTPDDLEAHLSNLFKASRHP